MVLKVALCHLCGCCITYTWKWENERGVPGKGKQQCSLQHGLQELTVLQHEPKEVQCCTEVTLKVPRVFEECKKDTIAMKKWWEGEVWAVADLEKVRPRTECNKRGNKNPAYEGSNSKEFWPSAKETWQTTRKKSLLFVHSQGNLPAKATSQPNQNLILQT